MKSRLQGLICIILFIGSFSCRKAETPGKNSGLIQLAGIRIGSYTLAVNGINANIPADQPIQVSFNSAVDTGSIGTIVTIRSAGGGSVHYTCTLSSNSTVLTLTPTTALQNSEDYILEISSALKGVNGETFAGIHFQFSTSAGTMVIDSMSINGEKTAGTPLKDIDPRKINIKVTFSQPLDPSTFSSSFSFSGPQLTLSLSDGNKTVGAETAAGAAGLARYTFTVSSSLTSATGSTFAGFSTGFFTGVDSTYKYPLITDDELLTLVQQQTFKYFWDFGHPACGMARERNSSGDIVTTGGSGFGIMAMIVAMARGFISRTDGLARLDKILGFLETCDRFHGVWPHWLNGATGKTVPFSPTENGGDLVETSYMLEGLIAMRQYLDSTVVNEKNEIHRINNLFASVEFDWFTNGESTLYWEWSPDYGFNLRIRGYNETLITYVIAASSTTHSISAGTYTNGYAANGGIRNGKSFYGYLLPLGEDYGGPLFFTHYSFLGLDPRNLKDQYADYRLQNVDQTLINRQYCLSDPKKYPGYGPGVWGLTASDNPWGYNAQSPTNDLGVITPTAAISSMPYTPEESMAALKTFYYFLGDRLWGEYGFFDAFDVNEGWWASSTLAIDQGPEICMIENYRSALLWDLFMSAPEIRAGLTKLGFTF